jgi:ribonucleoside-diphosphate reductase beta chain
MPLGLCSPPTYTVLNVDPDVDHRVEPMFLGAQAGLARSDRTRYPIFKLLTEEQYSNYWRPHDIDLEKDKIEFRTLPENTKHILLNNVAYQSLLDSEQSRAVLIAMLPWITNPELESCVKVWAFFEEIHNKSYEYILKNVFPDPSPFIDSILRNEAIVTRAKALTRYYDEFILYSAHIMAHGYCEQYTKREQKRLLYRMIVSVYVLESVRFYVSFTCTFAIAKQEVMLGNASQIKQIARDEALHVGITLNIIRIWQKGKDDPEMLEIMAEEEATVYNIFDECVSQEKAWGTHLLSKGELLGITVPMMDGSIEARANQRMHAIGLERRYPTKQDPFARWMSEFLVTADEQIAPQEKEVDTYKVSAINRTVDEAEVDMDF